MDPASRYLSTSVLAGGLLLAVVGWTGCGGSEQRCASDQDCTSVGSCSQARCVDGACQVEAVDGCCQSDADCDSGASCVDNTCVADGSGCESDSDCGADERCEPASGTCVAVEDQPGLCTSDSDCGPEEACILELGRCAKLCASDADCEPPPGAPDDLALVCSPDEGVCVPAGQRKVCQSDRDCPPDRPVCDTQSGLCTEDGDQPGGECSPACGEGEVCHPGLGRCVPDCREEGNTCPPDVPVCNPDDGLCLKDEIACEADSLELDVVNPASGVTWWAKAFFPADAAADNRYPAVVTVPGGSGAGSAMEAAADEARNPCKQAERGFVVVIFDADGRGNTGGVEDDCGHVHQDGLAALIGEVAKLSFVDPDRIGLSTSSFGITMGAGALARHPELPVRFLVDYEGPGDRTDTGHCDASDTGHLDHDCDDDAWWAEREATTFLLDVRVPYLRIQKERDHVQPDNLHCIRMINNATHTDHGGNGRAPWTRVNGAELNQANRTYSEDAQPAYYPAVGAPEAVDFWDEMFGLEL